MLAKSSIEGRLPLPGLAGEILRDRPPDEQQLVTYWHRYHPCSVSSGQQGLYDHRPSNSARSAPAAWT